MKKEELVKNTARMTMMMKDMRLNEESVGNLLSKMPKTQVVLYSNALYTLLINSGLNPRR